MAPPRKTRKPAKPYKSQLRALVLLLVLVVVLIVALASKPAIVRWSNLRHLTDPDLAKRELALNYVVRIGRHDPAVIRGAIARLGVEDEKNFLQIENAIDHAGMWTRPPVTDDAWLRWLAMLAEEKTSTARVVVAHELAGLPDMAGDPRVSALFERLQNDEDDDVRYAGLLAAAALAGEITDDRRLTPLLVRGTLDKNPEIARQAWIFLGLLKKTDGVAADVGHAPPAVAEAMHWAVTHTYPDRPAPVIPAVGRNRQDLIDLAALEKARPGTVDYPINRETPDMLRLAAVAAGTHPKPDDLRPLFNSDESTMRDLACVVAADRFSKEQNAALVDSLLRDLDDKAKISGAVLAGLTGVQGGLLTQKMKDENVWSVKLMMKLGLWMQGKMPEMARTASELLIRTDIPRSTLVLVLLHRKNAAGLDFLLNPRGEPPLDLIVLLDQKRWWRVLSKYLPGAPPFWVWADPELEQFQIDVLRDWYLVNREKLYPQ